MKKQISIKKVKKEKVKKEKIKKENPVKITGILSKTSKGFAFAISPSDGGGDIFISTSNFGTSMHGDSVLIELTFTPEEGTDKRREGKVIKVLERANEEIVGVYSKSSRYGFVIPNKIKLDSDIFIGKSNENSAKDGDIVVAKIINWPNANKSAEGIITEVLGKTGDPDTFLLALIREYNLSIKFPSKVTSEAQKIDNNISPDIISIRKDLRNITTITIDGADAKDLDDAVSISKLPNGNYLLGVHIADVSHYVKETTKLDAEAFKRGCSVYLIDTVLPMLPTNISNGVCSLNPRVDRLTLTCEIEIDGVGDTVSHTIYESVIRTTERMVYTDVSDILENKDTDAIEKFNHIHKDLLLMEELYNILSIARDKRGSVNFGFDEAFITLNDDGIPIDISIAERRIANKLIEEFMLKANETVAEHFFWLDFPFIYRIHEKPDIEKMELFKQFIATFGISLKGSLDNIHPKALNEIVKKAEGKPFELVINEVMLRSMKKAIYSPDCSGHFGLSLKYYCHFTSPIRRYPDLIVHRLIKENIHKQMTKKRQEYYKKFVAETSEKSSQAERVAQEIERDLEKAKKAEYINKHVGEQFEGVISGVTSFGIFVALPNTIEGLIPMRNLRDDYYIYEKEKFRLIGERHKKIFTLGDAMNIIVDSVDMISKEVNFTIV